MKDLRDLRKKTFKKLNIYKQTIVINDQLYIYIYIYIEQV